MNGKIVVTGANGYIGRHVITELLKKKKQVIAVDIDNNNIPNGVKFIKKSILDADEHIYEELGCPDVCIHLAWRDGFKHNSDTHMLDLPKHYQFIKNMYAGGLPNMSVMGTMHEIGYWEGAVTADTPTNPLSLYGIAKNTLRQSAKLLANQYNKNLNWLRGYYIVGDDQGNHSIFTKLLEKECEGAEKFPFTSGVNKYDFLDVNELAEQICAAALQTDISGEINCCSGKPVALKDKVEQFLKEHDMNIKLEYGAFPDRPYDSPAIWGDDKKIRQIMSKM
ncbi:Putative NADH-flavin reductase [uncultured Dorea sp.]|uniref:NAD-dependent epimerase/dehydratase family protein n=1 Tax=Dorea formicigenerans TaxID=39486 RepID=UPI000822A9AA|nr:NAD(P)-dependent oxidoreductase [uncultured Dorea sp.]SCH26267.1 Putative NADH-flavin reductase [uncultured Dorea sp.]